jgi:hypothetical protein
MGDSRMNHKFNIGDQVLIKGPEIVHEQWYEATIERVDWYGSTPPYFASINKEVRLWSKMNSGWWMEEENIKELKRIDPERDFMVGDTVLIQSPHQATDWGVATILEVDWSMDKNNNPYRSCYYVKMLETGFHHYIPSRRVKKYSPNQVCGG